MGRYTVLNVGKIAMDTSYDSNMFSIFYEVDWFLVDGDGVDRLKIVGEVLLVWGRKSH